MTEKLNVTIKLRKKHSTAVYELKEQRHKPMDADQQSPELISNVTKAGSGTFPP